jgi:protein-L-isoaspartate(D-aspartate) O-methyltransferase
VRTQTDLAELIEREVGRGRVAEAFRDVPRAAFVPDELTTAAYEDIPLRIPNAQVTTQPSLTARMLAALDLQGSERVLEVGTGYGFQTALLARLSGQVWSVERFADLAETARERLDRAGIRNAVVVVGDGSEGLPEHAPFDAILVSAAFPEVPPPLTEQLASGGRLVQPIGRGGNEDVVLFRKGPLGLERKRTLTGAHFVRLVGRHGFPD